MHCEPKMAVDINPYFNVVVAHRMRYQKISLQKQIVSSFRVVLALIQEAYY